MSALNKIVQMKSNRDQFKVGNQTIPYQQPNGNHIMICETMPKWEQNTQWSRYEVLRLDEHHTIGVVDTGQDSVKYKCKGRF